MRKYDSPIVWRDISPIDQYEREGSIEETKPAKAKDYGITRGGLRNSILAVLGK